MDSLKLLYEVQCTLSSTLFLRSAICIRRPPSQPQSMLGWLGEDTHTARLACLWILTLYIGELQQILSITNMKAPRWFASRASEKSFPKLPVLVDSWARIRPEPIYGNSWINGIQEGSAIGTRLYFSKY